MDASMLDIASLTDTELEALRLAAVAEQGRRRLRCETCGGQMRLWHLHICAEAGGANLPMDSDAARRITRTGS